MIFPDVLTHGQNFSSAPPRARLIKLLRGNIVRDVADILPEEIRLLVAA